MDAALLAAEARSRFGDPAAALDCCAGAQVRSPARADVRKLLGDVARGVGDGDLAREAYRVALDLDPGYVEVWVEYGRLCERRGDAREAEEAYRAGAGASAELRRRRARAGAPAARTRAAARRRCDVLIAHAGARPVRLRGAGAARAGACSSAGARPTRARPLERVVRFEPDHAGARYYLGLALARERRYREAVAELDRVIALEPSGPLAQQARAHARTARDLAHVLAGEAA